MAILCIIIEVFVWLTMIECLLLQGDIGFVSGSTGNMNLKSEEISTFEVNVLSLYTILLKFYMLIIDTHTQILILRQEENLTLQK